MVSTCENHTALRRTYLKRFCREYAQSPEESSWIQSSNNNNFTFTGFSGDNQLCIDQRGFKVLVQAEVAAIKNPGKLFTGQNVEKVTYSASNVTVTTQEGLTVIANFAICTFSVGVLQHKGQCQVILSQKLALSPARCRVQPPTTSMETRGY